MNREIEIPDGYEARVEGNKVVLEPKENEDERIRTRLIALVEAFGQGKYKNEMLAYLEKQKDEVQRQFNFGMQAGREEVMYEMEKEKEWSKEDEEKIDDIIRIICSARECSKIANIGEEKEDNSAFYNELVLFLKSIRPQPHWKPSEEQMEILQYLCEHSSHANPDVMPTLESLYHDLQKLL